MRISIAGVFLANGGREGPGGFSVNGEGQVDEAQFFRALASTFYHRANESTRVSFTVHREHADEKAAEVFVLTHRSLLPKEGDVRFYCGFEGSEQEVLLRDAVLTGSNGVYLGRSSRFNYTLVGGVPETDSIPAGVELDESVTRRGTVNIASGATSVAVTFSTMTSTPTAVATVYSPSGGDQIFATIDQSTVTASGFTARLSGPTPSADYKLGYVAIL